MTNKSFLLAPFEMVGKMTNRLGKSILQVLRGMNEGCLPS